MGRLSAFLPGALLSSLSFLVMKKFLLAACVAAMAALPTEAVLRIPLQKKTPMSVRGTQRPVNWGGSRVDSAH
jgi:hypothetical protein